MIRRTTQHVGWWALVGGTLVALAVTLAVKRQYDGFDLLFLALLCYTPVGALVAKRRPENPIGWIFMLVGLLAGLTMLSLTGVNAALEAGEPVAWWGSLSALCFNWFAAVLFLLATTVTFLLYPSGLLSPRWRPVLWLSVAATLVTATLAALTPVLWIGDPGTDANAFSIPNPYSPPFAAGLEAHRFYSGWEPPLAFSFLAGLASALIRARRSRGVERLQMRLFASAIVLLLVLLIPANWLAENGYSMLRFIVLAVGFACIPLSCGVAIMRHRLYDIDRIIGRTTAYALVTGVLLALYAAVVTAVTALLPGSEDAAVAAATLAAAAAFRPVLRWARRLVDRRFHREHFDAERTLEQFAVRLRTEVGGDEVGRDLLSVLDSTVQPKAAGIWMREPSA